MAISDIFQKVRDWFNQNRQQKQQIDQHRGQGSVHGSGQGYGGYSGFGYGSSGGSEYTGSGQQGYFNDLRRKYIDYDEMDDYPTLSAALDMYADEASKKDFFRDRRVWVEGENDNIVSDLNFLFDRQLEVDDWVWEGLRYLGKTGNNFERMFVNEKGVIATEPLPAPLTRRVHNNAGQLIGFVLSQSGNMEMNADRFQEMIDQRKKDKPRTINAHMDMGSNVAFEDWEVSHFRLKGKNRNRKYGDSIMESSRWVFRRLTMMEDAVVVHKLCLRGDSDIWTPNGYKKIKNVEEGDEVYCFGKDRKLRRTKVNYKEYNGTDDIYHVKSDHRDLYANATHPVLCRIIENNGSGNHLTDRYEYVEVQNIKPEKHEFVTPSVSEEDGEEIELNFPDVLDKDECWGGAKENNLPDKVTPDFARWFGFMLGDGFISEKSNAPNTGSVGFSIGDDEEINEYYKWLFEKFIGEVKKEGDIGYRLGCYCVDSKKLTNFMKMNGFIPGDHNKRIPDWVFRSTKQIQWEFLQGLFDAEAYYESETVNKEINRTSWQLELCNKELVKDVRHLSMQLGLRTTRTRHRHREGGHKIGNEDREIPPTDSYIVSISSKKQSISEPIRSVEKVGEDDIWDIGVEDEVHNFVANGTVVHNTRAPSRYVFYVDTGQMPPMKALEHVKQVKDEYKKKKIIDPETGEINMSYDPTSIDEDFFIPVHRDRGESVQVDTLSGPDYQCLTGDTLIELANSKKVKIKDLAEETKYENGFKIKSMGEGELPREADGYNARETEEKIVWALKLSNGKSLEASGDHPILTKDNGFIELQHLEEGNELVTKNGKLTANRVYVESVGRTGRKEQLYDLTVSKYHNFAVGAGIIVHNSVEDVDYFRKKMGRGMKIPNFSENDSAQSQPLTQKDYRFASAVERLQGAFTTGLSKIADVHLVATGRNPKEYNYKINMTPPSSIIELARIEVLSAKADILSRLEQHVSIRWLLTNVFGFSEEEAVSLMVMRQEEIDMESAADIERELARSKREAEMFGESTEDVLSRKQIPLQEKAELKKDRGAYGITDEEYEMGEENINPEKFLKEVREKDEELFNNLEELKEKLDKLNKQSKFNHMY